MLIKRLILLSLLILSLVPFAFGQGNWQPGYIIDWYGDTTRAPIAYRRNTANYQGIIIMRNGVKERLNVNDARGFGYDGDSYFENIEGYNGYVRVLVSGPLTLYKRDHFYILENEEGTRKVIMQEEGHYRDRWKGSLGYFVSDCLGDWKKRADASRFNDMSITKLVVAYNECKGKPFNAYGDELPWVTSNVRVGAGVVHSQIVIDGTSNRATSLAQQLQTTDPMVGVLFTLVSPRISRTTFFETGVQFAWQNFEGIEITEIGTQTNIQVTTIHLPYFTFPALFGYSRSNEVQKFSIKGGYQAFVPIAPKLEVVATRVYDDLSFTNDPTSPIAIIPLYSGPAFGISYQRNVGKYTLGVEGNYSRTTRMERESAWLMFQRMYSTTLTFQW